MLFSSKDAGKAVALPDSSSNDKAFSLLELQPKSCRRICARQQKQMWRQRGHNSVSLTRIPNLVQLHLEDDVS